MAEPEALRGAERAILLLRALNESSDATALNLSRATGIPRPSVYRLLETLIRLGYVGRNPATGAFRLTHRVRRLSDGFRDEDMAVQVAGPELTRLGRTIVWPIEFATFAGDAMCLRDTTRRISPLTFDRLTVGHRPPMLAGAHGRSYLAFCPENERREILGILSHSQKPINALARHPYQVAKILDDTRARGYGLRHGEFMPRTSAIGVPVSHRGRVIATLAVVFLPAALTPDGAAERYLDALRGSARQIEQGLAAKN